MISRADDSNLSQILQTINDAASAYKGIIPPDRWKEPYMPEEELRQQINDGVEFWKYADKDQVLGVMGIQFKGEVTLIRHAYVNTSERRKGIGSHLLAFLMAKSNTPILIGTWAAATWAIHFYQKQGFRLVADQEKNLLLKKYWNIPARQVETSVVLASDPWFESTVRKNAF